MKNVNGKRKKKHGELGRINKNYLSFAFAELQNNMVKRSTTGTTKRIECLFPCTAFFLFGTGIATSESASHRWGWLLNNLSHAMDTAHFLSVIDYNELIQSELNSNIDCTNYCILASGLRLISRQPKPCCFSFRSNPNGHCTPKQKPMTHLTHSALKAKVSN